MEMDFSQIVLSILENEKEVSKPLKRLALTLEWINNSLNAQISEFKEFKEKPVLYNMKLENEIKSKNSYIEKLENEIKNKNTIITDEAISYFYTKDNETSKPQGKKYYDSRL